MVQPHFQVSACKVFNSALISEIVTLQRATTEVDYYVAFKVDATSLLIGTERSCVINSELADFLRGITH